MHLRARDNSFAAKGFSLVELMTSTVIIGLISVSLFGLYSSARRDAIALESFLDANRLEERILQLLAEDLDRLAGDADDAQILIDNNNRQGFDSATLRLETRVYDGMNRPRTYEKVLWESRYDPESDALILYRAHGGMVGEDRLLHRDRSREDRELLIPLARGVTHFKVEAHVGGTPRSRFVSNVLPTRVDVSISFAPPEDFDGTGVSVPQDEIYSRSIAINRARKINYVFTAPELPDSEEEESEEFEGEAAGAVEDIAGEAGETAIEADERGEGL